MGKWGAEGTGVGAASWNVSLNALYAAAPSSRSQSERATAVKDQPDARLRQTASKEKAGELTKPLLAAHSVCGSRPYKGEGMDHFLARITHLHLQERGLMKLGALGSGCCPMASHVYTYDNKLETLEGLSACGYLTHLYVQNNLLRSVAELCTLKRLQKLYVSNKHPSSLGAIGAPGRRPV